MQKIGVIGSAVVGQTLAKGFKSHGYEWGEIIVLAVNGAAAEDALRAAGPEHLAERSSSTRRTRSPRSRRLMASSNSSPGRTAR
jgi:6-phosphogluconate dehydrogenase